MEPLTEHIQCELPQTAQSSSTFKIKIIPEVFRSRESNWIYDHTGLVYRGGNPNKETFINIPFDACSHSLVGLAKNWPKVGVSPIDRLDASILDRGPYSMMIWYLQCLSLIHI